MKRVIVIGGGPAGLIAAGISALKGNQVILIEKNNKVGKKLAITGKGRCNITNIEDMDTFFNSVMCNKKFLYSSFYGFNNYDVINFFEDNGVKTKVERGGRIFPVSDDAKQVVNALEKYATKNGVKIITDTKVTNIVTTDNKVEAVKTDKGIYECDAIVVATGGMSYPGTGSTGDGYKFAKKLGHNIVKCTPALIPFNIKEDWVKQLQGLSLRNVKITVRDMDNKNLCEDFGEMLFTHFGVSGPIILSASSRLKNKLDRELKLSIDLKPAIDSDTLDKRLIRDFEKYNKKDFKNALDDLLPQKLIPIIIHLTGIDANKKIYNITKIERKNIVELLKNLECTITGTRSMKEAIVTAGGIDVKEINPKTMESKIIDGLYFAGEVIDLDALTGGYNLQIAFSTGHQCGDNI